MKQGLEGLTGFLVACMLIYMVHHVFFVEVGQECIDIPTESGLLERRCTLVLPEVESKLYVWYDDSKGSQDGYSNKRESYN